MELWCLTLIGARSIKLIRSNVKTSTTFVKRFIEPEPSRSKLLGVKFKRLAESDINFLEESFTMEEVKEVV